MDLFLPPRVLGLPRAGEPVTLPVPRRQPSSSTCSCQKEPQSPRLDFYLSSVPCCHADLPKCHVGTHKLHSPLKKKVPFAALWDVTAAFQMSNLRTAGKNSLCFSCAFRITIMVVCILFLNSFCHDCVAVEALLMFWLGFASRATYSWI